MRTRRLAAAAAVAGLALAGGCGSDGDDVVAQYSTPGELIVSIGSGFVGDELAGLTVAEEDVSGSLAQSHAAYVDATSLYSLRTGDLLQATLQVSRFNDNAEYRTGRFQRQLLNQIGGTRPRAVRVGDDTVYLTTGTKQQLAVWFRDRYMFVLATRDDYDYPRGLLREALQVTP